MLIVILISGKKNTEEKKIWLKNEKKRFLSLKGYVFHVDHSKQGETIY